MREILILTIFTIIRCSLFAQEKTFEREYSYRASELDSKISCRAIAVNQLRTTLLNEIGVYVESEQILKTSDLNGKFSQDFVENIATISAGVTKLVVLDEKWNGETFWMKASITIDKKSLEESLKQFIADRQKVKQLEEVNKKLIDATNEINRLKEILTNSQTSGAKQIEYNAEINKLEAVDYYYKANLKLDSEDYLGAITDYNKAIELNPKYVEAYVNRGYSAYNLRDYKKAISDYKRATEIDPKNAMAYSNIGGAKNMLQDYNGALVECNKALELDPNYDDAYNNRANAKRGLGDYPGALTDYNKAIEINYHSNAYFNRGIIKLDYLSDYRGAVEDFSRVIEFHPSDASAYFRRGSAKFRLGQKKDSCLDLYKARELGDEDVDSLIKEYCK